MNIIMVLIIAEGITDCHQWSTTGLVVPLRATTVLTMILMTRAEKGYHGPRRGATTRDMWGSFGHNRKPLYQSHHWLYDKIPAILRFPIPPLHDFSEETRVVESFFLASLLHFATETQFYQMWIFVLKIYILLFLRNIYIPSPSEFFCVKIFVLLFRNIYLPLPKHKTCCCSCRSPFIFNFNIFLCLWGHFQKKGAPFIKRGSLGMFNPDDHQISSWYQTYMPWWKIR